jgi:hypothetical protein
VDPLSNKYPYNSTYAFQENKMGLGIELEGLELLKNNTGYFAIYNKQMIVKQAPSTQRDLKGNPTFSAGSIGLTTEGYNPNSTRIYSGDKQLRFKEYTYQGPAPDAAQMQDTTDKISSKDRQNFKTTKTGSDMWNLKQVGAERLTTKGEGMKEILKLVNLGFHIGDAFNSLDKTVQATKEINSIEHQAMTMDQAIKYVNDSGIEMNEELKADVTNYIFDGNLPYQSMMSNSNILSIGDKIMKANGIPIQNPEYPKKDKK